MKLLLNGEKDIFKTIYVQNLLYIRHWRIRLSWLYSTSNMCAWISTRHPVCYVITYYHCIRQTLITIVYQPTLLGVKAGCLTQGLCSHLFNMCFKPSLYAVSYEFTTDYKTCIYFTFVYYNVICITTWLIKIRLILT